MKVVIFDNPDGTITVRVPATNATRGPAAKRKGETANKHFERLVAGPNSKGGVRVAAINHTELPEGHGNFKEAREWNGTGVVVNMGKAKVLHEARIQAMRRVKARELIERETMGENVVAEKVQLKAMNVTGDISGAQTPAELHAVWPVGLERSGVTL